MPLTTIPFLVGYGVVLLLEIEARGELFETLREMDELLKHITKVREKMKAHWTEYETKQDR